MLPAGLSNDSNRLEIYAENGKAFALYRRHVVPFMKLPPHIINVFRREMDGMSNRCKSLGIDGISDENTRLEAYVVANYGEFDNTPDFDGQQTHPEIYGKEAIEHYRISPRELDVLKLVATGFSASEIGVKLFISTNTAIKHIKNIKQKLNLNTAVDLTRFAIKKKIIAV